jgi:hypothetical protein
MQRELFKGVVAEASYVGSIMRDLPVDRPFNAIPENFRAAAEQTFFATNRNPLNDAVTNPFFGILTAGTITGRTVTRGQLLRPFPQFTGVTAQSLPLGSSRYDAAQFKVTKRFASGFSLTGSYAISKTLEETRFLNEQDTALTRELNAFDIPQRLVVSSAYELPIGPGKALFGNTKGLVGKLLEGMQINALYQAQSGIPIDISGAESLGRSAKLESGQTINNWFDTTAFRQRQPIELVRTARLPDVRSAGRNNWDISFFKTTRLTETIRLQFRAESFNALNRPEWSSPSGAFGTANFGRVTSTNTFARQLQFALKLLW